MESSYVGLPRSFPVPQVGAAVAFPSHHVHQARYAGLYQELFMSFIIYLIGFAIFIGGVAWAMITAGVPPLYVTIASVILLGVGILTGVARTRRKDPA
jgi:hypothetical protein